MVVIHRAYGFRFVIYTFDHEPAHVHITGAGHGKVNLIGSDGMPNLVFATGIKTSDLRRLLVEIAKHRDRFLNDWERIHGRPD